MNKRVYGTEVSPSMMTVDAQPEAATIIETSKVLPSTEMVEKGQQRPIAEPHNPASRCIVSKITGRVYHRPQARLISYTIKDERV